MTDTYNAFDTATQHFTALALIRNGKPVGRIVVKFGNAATAFVQIWGAPMATARATGYGYDKASAAVMGAIDLLGERPNENDIEANDAYSALIETMEKWDGGTRYTSALEAAGFTLANVI